jgi:hypothetical protein
MTTAMPTQRRHSARNDRRDPLQASLNGMGLTPF